MNILILGGTQMLGRDLIEVLLQSDNYTITLANRGITNPKLFPECKRIILDRNNSESCSILAGSAYDIVVDFSCYSILQFKNTINYLNNTAKYILISTISVLDQNLSNINDPYVKYAVSKRDLDLSIKFLKNIPPTVIVRPCAIYGDNDYTNRFEKINEEFYWKNTGIKADKNSGCLSVRELSNKLISIIHSPIILNLETINITE